MSPHKRSGDETGRSVNRVGVAGRQKNKTQKINETRRLSVGVPEDKTNVSFQHILLDR